LLPVVTFRGQCPPLGRMRHRTQLVMLLGARIMVILCHRKLIYHTIKLSTSSAFLKCASSPLRCSQARCCTTRFRRLLMAFFAAMLASLVSLTLFLR